LDSFDKFCKDIKKQILKWVGGEREGGERKKGDL
jgi:hypothetical protein